MRRQHYSNASHKEVGFIEKDTGALLLRKRGDCTLCLSTGVKFARLCCPLVLLSLLLFVEDQGGVLLNSLSAFNSTLI